MKKAGFVLNGGEVPYNSNDFTHFPKSYEDGDILKIYHEEAD